MTADDIVPSVSWIESQPVTLVRIDSLVVDGSPRLAGEDREHIRLLAESGDTLPPITVHRPSMRVIDGMHRVRAAMLNGLDEISARLLDCGENAAFVLAVTANVTHGLPLSQPDRAAAAARIIADHPRWSDRAVAAATGLSDKTVSKIRCRATVEAPQSNSRLGRDGRVRPLDSGHRRRLAAKMIVERPDAGLREVARATGLSAATVHDVRHRISRGEDPVPGRYRPAGVRRSVTATAPPPQVSPPQVPPPRVSPPQSRTIRADVLADGHLLLAKLRHDPSLRFSEAGRQALRWLDRHVVDAKGLERVGHGLPDHWAAVVAGMARSCAEVWASFAEQLEQRTE